MADPLARFRNKIIVANAVDGLAQLPSESIDCVVTSPPYWGLRDYSVEPTVWDAEADCDHEWQRVLTRPPRDKRDPQTKKTGGSSVGSSRRASELEGKNYGELCAKCRGWRGCLGLEPTMEMFIEHLLQIFDQVWRVIKTTGTCWVNLGDSYGGQWGVRSLPGSQGEPVLVPSKSLQLVPHRFAIAMVGRGWIIRNHVVWRKPNHIPQSVRDRLVNTWDHIFFFVKKQRYWFDLDAIRVPHRSLQKATPATLARKRQRDGTRDMGSDGETAFHPNGKNPGDYWLVPPETRSLGAVLGESGAVKVPGGAGWTGHVHGGQARIVREQDPRWLSPEGKNPGDCWEIMTRRAAFAHFAAFPEKLVEMPIKAGCPLLVCRTCLIPKREVRRRPPNPLAFALSYRASHQQKNIPGAAAVRDEIIAAYNENQYTSKGGSRVLSAGCACKAGYMPGVVLDPFAGTATTCFVAKRLGCDYVGLELNADYARLGRARIRNGKRSVA